MSRKSFSLVELLVVIAIVAILVAMLMPSLARARFSAKVVNCASVTKQWGYAFSSHAGDNNRKLLVASHGVPNSGRNTWDMGESLFTTYENYRIDYRLWQCPMLVAPAGYNFSSRSATLDFFTEGRPFTAMPLDGCGGCRGRVAPTGTRNRTPSTTTPNSPRR